MKLFRKDKNEIIQKKTLKNEIIDLLRNQSCQGCKYLCISYDTTRKTEFKFCTLDTKNGCILDSEEVRSCENYEPSIRIAEIIVRPDDGNKIISKVDLIHLYDNKEIKFLIEQKGDDLLGRGPGIISYHMRLYLE